MPSRMRRCFSDGCGISATEYWRSSREPTRERNFHLLAAAADAQRERFACGTIPEPLCIVFADRICLAAAK